MQIGLTYIAQCRTEEAKKEKVENTVKAHANSIEYILHKVKLKERRKLIPENPCHQESDGKAFCGFLFIVGYNLRDLSNSPADNTNHTQA